MKQFFTFILLTVSLVFYAQQEKTIYAKARIYYNNPLDLVKLSENGIPIDHGMLKKNVFIESVFSQKQLQQARDLGYSVKVSIKNMALHLAMRKTGIQRNVFPCNANLTYQTPVNFELGSMGGFYTLDEMLQELDDMHTLYPNLITAKAPIDNYTTEEGRSIYYVKISDNPNADENDPEMLFTAIHHAREPAAMQQLIFYMWYLLENYDTNTKVKSIVDNTEQFFVPIVNPDGYRYNQTTNPNGGGYWRKNRKNNGGGNYGVDNNRNYSYHWGESGVSGPSGDTYNGTAPFSEVENQAIKWLSEQHQFKIAVNNHTYSSLLLYPFGYASNTPTADNAIYENISDVMVQENGYINEIASALYPAAGDSDDWMYGDTSTKNKIFAMTPEIGTSFWPNQNEIESICKEMLFHNLTAAHLVSNYASVKLTNTDLYISSLNFDVAYTIKRLGLQEPANFTVSVVPVSSNISSVSGANSHTNMAMLEEQNNSITVQLSPTIAQGDAVVYKVVLNNGAFNKEYVVEKIYGTPTQIFYENGNTTNQFSATDWGISQASYYSAPYSLTDSQNSNYSNNTNSTITVNNPIDLSNVSQASVQFYAKWDIEKSWDYVQFEISTDNGLTWQPQCGNYTKKGLAQQGIENEPMYDGTQNNWVKEEINLNDYLGQNIKFRFQLVSDQNTTADGFYFDELKIFKLENASAKVTNNNLHHFDVYPNPAKNSITIHTNLNQNFKVVLADINGKIIQKKELFGFNNVLNIKNLDTGIYFITVTTNSLNKTFKIIKN